VPGERTSKRRVGGDSLPTFNYDVSMKSACWLPAVLLCVHTMVGAQQASSDSVASRQIAVPCRLIDERATQYLGEHDFHIGRTTEGDDIFISLRNRSEVLTPSAKPLSLSRFSIHKYTLHRHLSPLKQYDDFRLEGLLRLAKATEGSCNATLHFEFSAYEWAWPLAVIDDGYRSKFISNGRLEQLYLNSIGGLFTKTNP